MKIKSFSLGTLVGTPGALTLLTPERIAEILQRHLMGDWGLCGKDDWHLNDLATFDGSRIFSVYRIVESDENSERIWVITEAEMHEGMGDRNSTCVMRPEDY